MALREDQEKIASYTGGYMAVPAVPGAGKTFTLAELSARLLAKRQKSMGKLLIVTCMNSAASNIKSRIAKFLGERKLPVRGFEVKTLHSLAVKIIRYGSASVQLDDDFQIITDDRKKLKIYELCHQWIDKHHDEFYSFIQVNEKWSQERIQNTRLKWEAKFVDLCQDFINSFKDSRLSEDELFNLFGTDPLFAAGLEIYKEYRHYQASNNSVDFNDMIVKSLELLETNSAVLEHFQNEWEYIFEDEAQDSSSLQQEILYLLSKKKGNLVRVGDLNQSIMGTFTLSDPSLFRDYCLREKTEEMPIYTSGRSGASIYKLANEFIKWTRGEHPEEHCRNALEDQMISPAAAWDKSSGREFANPPDEESHAFVRMFKWNSASGKNDFEKRTNLQEEERKKIAELAKQSLERNPDSTIGILVPNNKQVELMINELEDIGVEEYEAMSQCPPERKKVLELVGAIIGFITRPDEVNGFLNALEQLGYLSHVLNKKSSERMKNNKIKLRDWLKEIGLEKLFYPLEEEILCPDWLKSETWSEIHEGMNRLKKFLALNGADEADLILQIGQQLKKDIGLSEDDLSVVQRIAYETRNLKRTLPNWRISDLPNELKSDKNQFEWFINTIYDRKGFDPKKGCITVCTCHKSKGLEWDTVYLIHINESEYPSYAQKATRGEYHFLDDKHRNPLSVLKGKLKEPDKSESVLLLESKEELVREKARLLYVGITRAKKNICLSGFDNSRYLIWCKDYLSKSKNRDR